MNQQGNSTLLGMTLVLLVSLMGLKIVSYKLDNLRNQNIQQSLHLCAKNLNGITKSFISKMKKSNNAIMLITLAQRGAEFIPGGVVVSQSGMEQAKNLLKLSQSAFYLSYMNKSRQLLSKKCVYNPFILTSPYKLNLSLGFQRDLLGRAKVRGTSWKYTVMNTQGMIFNKINLKESNLKLTSKKINSIRKENLF